MAWKLLIATVISANLTGYSDLPRGTIALEPGGSFGADRQKCIDQATWRNDLSAKKLDLDKKIASDARKAPYDEMMKKVKAEKRKDPTHAEWEAMRQARADIDAKQLPVAEIAFCIDTDLFAIKP